MRIPRVKVCGVTREEDLHLLAEAGVDAVGFNFVPSSPRRLQAERTAVLCASAAELGLLRVAVVMDASHEELINLLSTIDVDFVQLHGSEPPSLAAACGSLPIIKATSWTGRRQEADLVADWNGAMRSAADHKPPSRLSCWLVDAFAPQQGGGTGRVARWDLLKPRPVELSHYPLVLAGGLNASNVQDAIRATQADGVDTASGVELTPGVKDPRLVHQFASRALEAFRSPPLQ
jgi:phosphoribosylanthranilate isomerase